MLGVKLCQGSQNLSSSIPVKLMTVAVLHTGFVGGHQQITV